MKNVRLPLFLSVLILSLPLLAQKPVRSGPVLQEAPPEATGMSSQRLERLDAVAQNYIDKGLQAGIVVLVARNGRIVHYKAYGQDDIATKTPLKRDAIFRIASQTKAITTVAAMMLYEEGRFLLDDPVSKYIPAFKKLAVLNTFDFKDSTFTTIPAKSEITIRQLLTQTSGISYPGIGTKEANAMYAKAKVPSGIGTPNDLLADGMARLATLPLVHQPGEKWTYGLNTDLLGYLVEVLSGKTLAEFMQNRVFEPLGMKDTFFYLPAEKQPRLTTLYTEFGPSKSLLKVPASYKPDFPKEAGRYYSGGAGLSSTAYDYAVFLQMLLNGGEYNGKRLLSPAIVRMMTTNQIGDLFVGAGPKKFGLGFGLATEAEATRIPVSVGSFDWGGLYGTSYWADPKEGIVALLLTQKYPNSAKDLEEKFRILVYQAISESRLGPPRPEDSLKNP